MVETLREYKQIWMFILFYWCICLYMRFNGFGLLYGALPWNVFLAVLPLFFIRKAESMSFQGKNRLAYFWGILWLLFFPNSVYMITDFIHISKDQFFWIIEAGDYLHMERRVYSHDIVIWIELLMIGMGFFTALLVGLESLRVFAQNIEKKVGRIKSWFSVAVVAILSSTGVYIGRFLRFNSWDILFHPLQLLKQLIVEFDTFSFLFIVAFSMYILGIYLSYRAMRQIAN